MKKLQHLKKAFTLAEVLITLGIIGVVAAITIPIVAQNIRNTELKSALKKNYSLLIKATQAVASDNNGTLANLCTGANNHKCLAEAFKDKLRVNTYCPANSGDTSCWHDVRSWYKINGSYTTSDRLDRPNMILNDGTLLSFWAGAADCAYTANAVYTTTTYCGNVVVDINGFKKPNTMGKDIFQFIFLTNTAVPEGSPLIMTTDYIGNTCNPASATNSDGYVCGYYYLFVDQ